MRMSSLKMRQGRSLLKGQHIIIPTGHLLCQGSNSNWTLGDLSPQEHNLIYSNAIDSVELLNTGTTETTECLG